MRVGELRKALEGVADDVPVVAIPKGGQALSDRIPTNHAFCVSDRTDSYVGAFAIEIAQTVVGVLGAELLADDPHAPAPGTASAFRRAAEPMPSSYGNPRNVSLDQGYREPIAPDVPVGTPRPRDGMGCGCFDPQVIGKSSKCLRCGGWVEHI